MPPLTPAKAEAFRFLRDDLFLHLDEAEFLAQKCEQWVEEDVDQARRLIADLVVTIRTVLFEHQAVEFDRCRFCFRPWPCPTVQAIHQVVKAPNREFVKLVEREA
ncbi:MAG: hypothetical protein JWQ81_4440 [Amycolatopsis sp.]|jgi:hypothetical protein|uniref:hypothetical protein n=1 Tax=Amycolatopsis sp. TaxID=37632 RepID=UPI002626CD8A|nr:hypothetical protein [Amycolatopsis sp.]MCU1683701.1 hypothetical protein [Amycolatopsis sp.]